jgi:hypothetical protein
VELVVRGAFQRERIDGAEIRVRRLRHAASRP